MMRTDLTSRELGVLQMLPRPDQQGNWPHTRHQRKHRSNHVNSIIAKLDVSDRTEAATTAIQRGLIEAQCS